MRCDELQLASGSVAGRDHEHGGRNNQDALCVTRGPEGVVAVVCDGCGSGAHSEVGARLGARIVAEAVRRRLAAAPSTALDAAALWADVQTDVLAPLRQIAAAMGGELARTIREHLLFTVVGAVVTDDDACVFHLGDGFLAVNDERLPLGPYADDAPPYLAYALLGADVRFEVARRLPAAEVRSLVIGTDGVCDLPPAVVSGICAEARTFTNADAVRRRLAVYKRGARLPDDTTLVVVRRPASCASG